MLTTIFSFITSAAGGSVVGLGLKLLTSWSETFRKSKEADIQIKLVQAQTASAEKVAAWQSFDSSQKQATGFSIPAGCWTWVTSVVTLALGFVEALRQATRPALTWVLCYIMARAYHSLPMVDRVSFFNEIVFATFTALFWWFGERYSSKKGKS